MKTDDLIAMLARDAGAVRPDRGGRRFALALAVAVPCSALLMLATLGINPALDRYVELPNFWMKVLFVLALAAIGLVVARRLSRPGVKLGRAPQALAVPVLAVWAIAVATLAPDDAAQRAEAFFGQTWTVCPLLIAMLSVPIFAATTWAMRGLAPTRLRLAGAAAGLLSGAAGALVYCLHCPELAAPFVGFWYLLGVLIPTGIGALLGRRLLQW
jgi:hypothetical protein